MLIGNAKKIYVSVKDSYKHKTNDTSPASLSAWLRFLENVKEF